MPYYGYKNIKHEIKNKVKEKYQYLILYSRGDIGYMGKFNNK